MLLGLLVIQVARPRFTKNLDVVVSLDERLSWKMESLVKAGNPSYLFQSLQGRREREITADEVQGDIRQSFAIGSLGVLLCLRDQDLFVCVLTNAYCNQSLPAPSLECRIAS